MLRIELRLEDMLLVAQVCTDEADPNHGKWVGTATDDLKGTVHHFALDNVALGAVLALATGMAEEDKVRESRPTMVHQLYHLAEQAVRGWPKECRPIP